MSPSCVLARTPSFTLSLRCENTLSSRAPHSDSDFTTRRTTQKNEPAVQIDQEKRVGAPPPPPPPPPLPPPPPPPQQELIGRFLLRPARRSLSGRFTVAVTQHDLTSSAEVDHQPSFDIQPICFKLRLLRLLLPVFLFLLLQLLFLLLLPPLLSPFPSSSITSSSSPPPSPAPCSTPPPLHPLCLE